MNILKMTNAYLHQVGGVAGSVARFTEAPRDMDYRVLIVAPSSCCEHRLFVYQDSRDQVRQSRHRGDETLWQCSIDQIKAEGQLWTNMAVALGEVLRPGESNVGSK